MMAFAQLLQPIRLPLTVVSHQAHLYQPVPLSRSGMNSTVVLLALAAFTASDSTSFSILVSSPLLVRHPHSAPDLVDISETIVFDGAAARLRLGEDLPAAGVITLHHLSGDRLSSYALRLTIGPGRLRKLAVNALSAASS
jgi:hypothetical protein